MERALILSDTHMQVKIALNIIRFENNNNKINRIIHLGDLIEDAYQIQENFPNIKVETICGNCDFGVECKDEDIITLGGRNFFITHGHLYDVKYGLDELVIEADKYKKTHNIYGVLFGYTHVYYNEFRNNILYFNPGAIMRNSIGSTYGIIEVTANSIYADRKEINGEIYRM